MPPSIDQNIIKYEVTLSILMQKHAFSILYSVNENKPYVKHLKLIIIYILFLIIRLHQNLPNRNYFIIF
jgi:hypothetical protein